MKSCLKTIIISYYVLLLLLVRSGFYYNFLHKMGNVPYSYVNTYIKTVDEQLPLINVKINYVFVLSYHIMQQVTNGKHKINVHCCKIKNLFKSLKNSKITEVFMIHLLYNFIDCDTSFFAPYSWWLIKNKIYKPS